MSDYFFSFDFLIAMAAEELLEADIRAPWLLNATKIRNEDNQ